MRRILAATALVSTLLTGAALAQEPGRSGAPPRNITSTGVTKPPGGGSPMAPAAQAEMAKAQKAATNRDKAWDSKMRTTMGSICKGC
ncbi:hypothetical protein [Methylobacterium planeticum]|uniref:Uncharacterized protein n=1 Tax=Methylobacterium planeticum TaxID=2615211 RepID=A0A6N6MUP4_9HYPH|nr:hypothetical protein [Methylobacterium planeticum]KAB1073377.1 hypothetical protein F6X51_11525 [Methylobacterium planeticum]